MMFLYSITYYLLENLMKKKFYLFLFSFAAKLEGRLFLTHLRSTRDAKLNPSWSIHAEKYKIATSREYFNNNNNKTPRHSSVNESVPYTSAHFCYIHCTVGNFCSYFIYMFWKKGACWRIPNSLFLKFYQSRFYNENGFLWMLHIYECNQNK